MAILPVGETFALNADRYQIYPASPYGPFVLGQGLQAQEFSFSIPNEAILEIGNEEQRGVLVRSAQFAGTLSSLLVDTDLIQIYSSKMGSVSTPIDGTGTSLSGNEKTVTNVVSPVNFASGTVSKVFTIEAMSEDQVRVSGEANDTLYNTDYIFNPVTGLECVVLNSGELTVGDTVEFTVTKETEWQASDFKNSKVDFLIVARDNSTGDNVFKSDYADGMISQSNNIDTSAEGMAQISFDNEGNTYVSQQGYTYRKSVYANTEDVSNGYIDLDDRVLYGDEIPHVGSDAGKYSGKYFLKATRTNVEGTQTTMVEKGTSAIDGDFEYTHSTQVFTPYNITLGDRYEFTYFSLVSGTTYDIDFSHTGTPDVVDGRYVPVHYGNEKLETVESATISIGFNRERKSRQGYVDDYFTPAKVPTITGDIASMDGDLKLVKLLTKGDINTSEVQFDYNEHGSYTNINNVASYISVIDPADGTSEVVRFTISRMQITDSSIPIAVGSDTGRSFSWTSKNGACLISRG